MSDALPPLPPAPSKALRVANALTWVLLPTVLYAIGLGRAVSNGYESWHRPTAAGYGYAFGCAAAAGLIGLGLASLVKRGAPRAFLPSLWLCALAASTCGHRGEGKARRDHLATISARVEEVQTRIQAGLAAGEDASAEVTELDGLTRETETLADSMPMGSEGDLLRCAVRVTSEVVSRTVRTQKALDQLNALGGISMKGISHRARLDDVIASVDAWLAENDGLVRALETGPAVATRCLEEKHVPTAARDGFREEAAAKGSPTMIEPRRVEAKIGAEMRALLVLARERFGAWKYDPTAGSVVIEDEPLRRAWDERLRRIDELERHQEALERAARPAAAPSASGEPGSGRAAPDDSGKAALRKLEELSVHTPKRFDWADGPQAAPSARRQAPPGSSAR